MTQIQPIITSTLTNNNTTAVQVALRVRPLTQADRSQPRFSHSTNSDVIKTFENSIVIVPHQKSFQFDHVFDASSTQNQVFNSVASNFVDRFIDGYNVTILAYGQTSSGKTYTMGTAIDDQIGSNPEQEGIIPRAMSALFQRLEDIRKESLSAITNTTTTNNNNTQATSTAATNNLKRVPSVLSTFPPTSGLRAPRRSPSIVKLRPVSSIAPPPPRRGSNTSITSNYIPPMTSNDKSTRYTVHVSFIEIYNEELIDLLNPAPPHERTPVTIREDTKGHIIWTGLKEVPVGNTQDVLRYLQMGTENRATGSTDMNAKSSRSHAIFSVTLKQEKWVQTTNKTTPPSSSTTTTTPATKATNRHSTLNVKALIGQMEKQSGTITPEPEEQGEWMITNSKFHFVDLAGSERLKRTAAQGDRRKEGININAGLLALGNVISALSDPSKKSTHVPYRDSKLTRLLQDSLGGNSTTLMIACVSPAEINLTETTNTIKYAYRARNIRNKSERNEQEEWMTTDNLDHLRHMIQKLKSEVKSFKGINHRGTPSPLSSSGSRSPRSPTSSYAHGIVSPSSSSMSTADGGDLLLPSISATTNLTIPDPPSSLELFDSATSHHPNNEIAVMVSDLRRQIEELQNEVTVTRERNQLVERELRQKQQQQQQPTADAAGGTGFQHLVEPVIEEYEKSISGLESQLAMARAALSHSDQALVDQQTKIEQFQVTQKTEVNALHDLKSRLAAALDREHSSEGYCLELEAKLEKSVREGHKDQQILSELREKIIKFKDMDDHTEQYISDLESRLSAADLERVELTERIASLSSHHATTKDESSQTEHDVIQQMQQLEKELSQCQTKCQEFEHELKTIKEQPAKTTTDQFTQSDKFIDEESAFKISQLLTQKESQVLSLDSQLQEIEQLKSELTLLRDAHVQDISQLEESVSNLKEQCLSYGEQFAAEQLRTRALQEQDLLRSEEIEKYKLELNALQLVEEKQDAIIQSLELKLDEMDLLVSSLRTQLQDRNQTIQHLETENATKSEIAVSMQKKLQGVLKDVCGMSMERKQLEKIMHFMEGTLRLQEAKADKSIESLKDIKHHYKVREEEIEEKRRTVNLLSAEKQELSRSLQQVYQRASQGDAMVKTLVVELDEARLSITQLKAEQAQSSLDTQRLHALEARVHELDVEIEFQKNAKLEKEQELNQLEHAVQNQLVQNGGLIKTIADLENTIREERALASTQDSTGMIAELENKLSVLLQTKKCEDDAWKAHMEKTKEELYLSRKENQEFKLKIEALEVSLEKVKKQISDEHHVKPLISDSDSATGDQQELIEKIIQLQEDNAQLLKHNDNLESQLVLQRGQLTLETKNLELELMKLTAANDRLEKEMEQVIPRNHNNGNLTSHNNNRDSMQFTSPPQTPRIASPPPPTASNSTGSMIHYKLQRDISSSSIAKLTKSGSYRSVSTILQQDTMNAIGGIADEEAFKRLSTISMKSDAMIHPRPSSSLRASRTIISSTCLPPPTAPPSNPLPPIPTPLPPLPCSPPPPSMTTGRGSPNESEPVSPSNGSESSLHRQDSTASISFSEIMNATSSSNFTADQYDKLIRSLQRKAQFAENDVRAHQEVITKLESQLSRSESSVREVKKQLDLLSREKHAYNLEIQNLRTQVTQIQTQQKNTTDEQVNERKELEEQLEAQKALKEKAERARRILENRMDELMNKKSKFMCF